MAVTQPATAIIDPTERSIPFVIITRVIPVAMIPTIDTEDNIFIKFFIERKYGDAKVKYVDMASANKTKHESRTIC